MNMPPGRNNTLSLSVSVVFTLGNRQVPRYGAKRRVWRGSGLGSEQEWQEGRIQMVAHGWESWVPREDREPWMPGRRWPKWKAGEPTDCAGSRCLPPRVDWLYAWWLCWDHMGQATELLAMEEALHLCSGSQNLSMTLFSAISSCSRRDLGQRQIGHFFKYCMKTKWKPGSMYFFVRWSFSQLFSHEGFTFTELI